jgi:hypothetical protein
VSRPVFITGAARSGTSLVAAIVHRLGFQIAPTIPAPMPPTWRSDYEDPHFSLALMAGDRPSAEYLRRYLARRRAFSAACGFEGRIALKSPYLVRVWARLLEAAPDAFTIRVRREDAARARSLTAQPALMALGHDFSILEGLRSVQAHVDVWYEAIVARPAEFVVRLASLLGVSDHEAIDAAIALVGQPTRYPPCPSESVAAAANGAAKARPSPA